MDEARDMAWAVGQEYRAAAAVGWLLWVVVSSCRPSVVLMLVALLLPSPFFAQKRRRRQDHAASTDGVKEQPRRGAAGAAREDEERRLQPKPKPCPACNKGEGSLGRRPDPFQHRSRARMQLAQKTPLSSASSFRGGARTPMSPQPCSLLGAPLEASERAFVLPQARRSGPGLLWPARRLARPPFR